MKTKNSEVIMQNKVFLWIAFATGLILLIPLMGMQFSDEVIWSVFDFAIMGTLILSFGSIFVLIARKVQKKEHRVVIGIVLLAAFFLAWVELAVGLFGTPFAGN